MVLSLVTLGGKDHMFSFDNKHTILGDKRQRWSICLRLYSVHRKTHFSLIPPEGQHLSIIITQHSSKMTSVENRLCPPPILCPLLFWTELANMFQILSLIIGQVAASKISIWNCFETQKRHRPGLVSPVVGVAFRFMNLEKGRHTYEATSKFIYRTSFSSSDIWWD